MDRPTRTTRTPVPAAVGHRRWRSQLLTPDAGLDDPADVVRWMGALQAQDHGQSLWAVASRLRVPSVAAVEAAAAARTIVRTWPMRGTIHWVPAVDADWMVALSQQRMAATHRTRQAQLGLTGDVVDRARDLLVTALRDGPLDRPTVMRRWTDGGIAVDGQRGYHLLWTFAHERLVLIGPMAGRQQTFVLFDQAVPVAARARPADPGAELARRYLQSHTPCTARDFAWWCGCTLTEARRRLAAAGAVADPADAGERGWLVPPGPVADTGHAAGVALIAGFDEFLLGYQDRSDVLPAAVADRIVPGGNGVFLPCVVVDGVVVGTWKRTIGRDRVDVAVTRFDGRRPSVRDLTAAARRYAGAVGRSAVDVTVG